MKSLFALLALAAAHVFGAVQAPPLEEAAATSERGLSLTFMTPDGRHDTRLARLVALHVPQGQAPTPFLPAGPFMARWEGEVLSELRAEYTFSAEAQGAFKLTINGELVLDDATAKAGKTVQLKKGPNTLVAELSRPPSGDAHLVLRWAARDFPPEPVPPTAFTHNASATDLRAGERLRQGRLLFAQWRCAACHDSTEVLPPKGEGMPELTQDAPVFDELGAKYNEAWMAHWISDPHSIRPHALMPQVFASAPGEVSPQAADLAAYFASLGTRRDEAPAADLAPEGGALFANLGCIACHAKPDAEGPDERDRVPLGHVKAKWQAPALESYLKDPAKNFRWNRMPHFRLSDAEAKRLSAYLLTTATREFPAGPKGDASKGGPLLATAGCLNCHAGLPPMGAPKLATTLEAGWSKGCLADDAGDRGKAPWFGFAPAERAALRAFAAAGFSSLKQEAPEEFAERQVKNMRCTACHARDGEQSIWSQLDDETSALQAAAPPEEGEGKPIFTTALPPFTWLGEKLHPDWMAAFIAGQGKEKPRPWIVARMPGFVAIAEPMARGLSAQHGLPETDAPTPLQADHVAAGETLLGENGGFNCTTCHGVGERPPTAVFEAPGINLALTQARIRHGYFSRWVMAPQRIDPDTKMPKFADDEGKTPLTDLFEGKAAEQFEAIWQYLHSFKP